MNPMRGVFHTFDITAAGMRAEMQRAEIVAANISHMHTTRTAAGGPYRRKTVVFEEVLADAGRRRGPVGAHRIPAGVRVAGVYEDHKTQPQPRYMPGHPDADEKGWVQMPNVDVLREMVDLSVVERSFQANLAAMNVYRNMVQSTVRNIGR